MPGYSGTPLVRKLGIRPNERIAAINAPTHYPALLVGLPASAVISARLTSGAKFVHLFVTERADLEKRLSRLREQLEDAGILWISWPKKAAKMSTDVTEDTVRAVALPFRFRRREGLCSRRDLVRAETDDPTRAPKQKRTIGREERDYRNQIVNHATFHETG